MTTGTEAPGTRHAWRRAAVAVVVVVLLAELAARFVEPQLLTDTLTIEPELIEKRAVLDRRTDAENHVVVVGTSDMDAGVREAPFVAASDTYTNLTNASLLGLSPRTLAQWIPQVLDRSGQPDLLVVGIGLLTPTADGRDGIRPARDAAFETVLSSGDDDPGARAESAFDWSALVRNRASIRQPELVGEAAWRRIRGRSDRILDRIREVDWSEGVDDDGSVVFYRNSTYRGGRPPELEEALDDLARPGGIYGDALRDLFDQLAGLDVPTMVVIPPLPIDALVAAGATPESISQLRHELVGLAEDAGVPLADFSAAGYGNELFADFVHLNDAGSRRFSADLAATLDHR